MPSNQHLTWTEFRDFTPGLHTADSSFLMPVEAFQVMEDAQPQPGGGLRAFYKANTSYLDTTGIVSATNERITWVQPFLESTGYSYLMFTKHVSTGLLKGYTRAVGASSWTNSKSFTAHGDGFLNGGVHNVTTYWNNNSTLTTPASSWFVGTVHNKSDGTEDGWYLVYPNGTWTRVTAGAALFYGSTIVQYQARMVGSRLNQIWWSDPGSTTEPDADNYLLLQSGKNDVNDIITSLHPYSPSSLLVSTHGSGWFVIDGDITDPVVREMGKGRHPYYHQKMVTTPTGVIFAEPGKGVFITQSMAADFERLDTQLEMFDMSLGHGYGFAYHNGLLFAPAGRVLDFETGAWFTLSDSPDNIIAHEATPPTVNSVDLSSGVILPQFKASGNIVQYELDDTSQRNPRMRVKTAPLQAGNGRQIVIREVEVFTKAFNADSTVTVTVGGVAREFAVASGADVTRFNFNARGEYLDVEVLLESNNSSIEAPILESFRVGVRGDGHNTRPR